MRLQVRPAASGAEEGRDEMTRGEFWTVAGVVVALLLGIMSTVRDMRIELQDMRTELRDVRTESRDDNVRLRTELRADNAELRTELRADNAELRKEVGALRADVTRIAEDVGYLRGRMDERDLADQQAADR